MRYENAKMLILIDVAPNYRTLMDVIKLKIQ